LRTSESEAQQQLQQQLSEGQLVHKLVDAKLQLAQADLSMQDLKRQLERERKTHVQALARLTSLQANFDQYNHEHQAAGLDCCKPICCYV
jgi:cell fate regulator YaaT (PSP1 superfamily)